VGDGGGSTAAIVLIAALPIVLTAATAFTKVSVVLGALRVGLGAEAILSLPVIFALSVVLTAVVMTPVGVAISGELQLHGGAAAWAQGVADGSHGWQDAALPWQEFLLRHADAAELEFFAGLHDRATNDPIVVVPAFLMTELREALVMAVVILVPLVVVDLLVAQTTTLLGMTSLQVALVSAPLKLLLFLAVDGWRVVVEGLVAGYR
jgi:type III secretory pathway component EscR